AAWRTGSSVPTSTSRSPWPRSAGRWSTSPSGAAARSSPPTCPSGSSTTCCAASPRRRPRTARPRPRSRRRLPPPVRDRQAAVAAEVLRGDLRAGRVLPPLVLGPVHHADHPGHELRVMARGDELVAAHVVLHVVDEHPVEDLVRRQRVG